MSTAATSGADAAEILHQAGYRTIVAGASPWRCCTIGALGRPPARPRIRSMLYKGQTIPRSLIEKLNKVNDDKAFPCQPRATQYRRRCLDNQSA